MYFYSIFNRLIEEWIIIEGNKDIPNSFDIELWFNFFAAQPLLFLKKNRIRSIRSSASESAESPDIHRDYRDLWGPIGVMALLVIIR